MNDIGIKTHLFPRLSKSVIPAVFILSRRRQNRPDGPAFLKEQGESGESGSRAEAWDCTQEVSLRVLNNRLAYHSRSPVFRTLSRSSSGYFSFDSEPSSPLITHSTATQTPSPSSQVISHALQRISHAQDHGKDPKLLPVCCVPVLGMHAARLLASLCDARAHKHDLMYSSSLPCMCPLQD